MLHLSKAADNVPIFHEPWKVIKHCYTCVLAKLKCNSHTEERRKPTSKLKIIATDILDPTAGTTIDGHNLIVNFVDVLTGYNNAYLPN